MSNSESKICPHCGKIQEEESIFCGFCGGDLSSITAKQSIDNRILTHRPPLENEEFSRKSRTSKQIGRFTRGSEDSGEFDKSTFAEATYIPSRENASRASSLAIITFFINLLFIPIVLYFPMLGSTLGVIIQAILGIALNLFFIPTILGLRFVSQAEVENEDKSMISLAKILLGAQFIGWLVVYIGGLTFIIFAYALI